jgi:hypothetical protein
LGQWLIPVILATKKAEIRRIMVQSQPGQIVHKILSQKKNESQKNDWWGGSRSNPSTTKENTKSIDE